MSAGTHKLRDDALAIWKAAVAAVDSRRLVAQAFDHEQPAIILGDERISLDGLDRIVVVGAGKATAGMAAGFEDAFEKLKTAGHLNQTDLIGWVNVPADCIAQRRHIHLHAGRPAGVNEPTEAGVDGTRKMLELVSNLGPRDLCVCLISGGGSALLVAPVDGVSLADKQALTRFLSRGGANIAELNTVRKRLSRVKAGGLARACTAGRLVTLIISDVLGDPLDLIASGPTVDNTSTVDDAWAILNRYDPKREHVPESVWRELFRQLATPQPAVRSTSTVTTNFVLGNLAVAVDAAGVEAVARDYRYAMTCARSMEGPAEQVGAALGKQTLVARGSTGLAPNCLISGGEPTVTLPRDDRTGEVRGGRGGRNQQLALAALCQWLDENNNDCERLSGMVLLSGGTDGEDGPTDAAGAIVDIEVARRAKAQGLDPHDFLKRCDAYPFFEATGGLIKTGPTHTNVCDVRVALVDRP